MKKKIFICCTEQSGENICYNILSRLDLTNVIVDGVCGKRSDKFLDNKFYDISEFKSIGLLEILFSILKYINMINFLKQKILKKNYDLIICIDSPDFNYHLIKSLRKKNYSKKIIQIVAPTVWAWRENRAKKFSNIFDEIFVLFEFERKYFQFSNIKCTFIGHPIYYLKKRLPKKNYKFISFLYGSRENEINKLHIYFDEIEKYIHENKIDLKIFIPTLPHLIDKIKYRTKNWKTETIITTDIENFENYYNDVLMSITCSGTATLEIAKRNIPQIIIYKLNFFTELILRKIVKVKYACLINIVSKKMIIPEVVNSNLNKINLIKIFNQLLNNESLRNEQIRNINYYIDQLESNDGPYDISANRIAKLM